MKTKSSVLQDSTVSLQKELKKKILITGWYGMLAYDFVRTQGDTYDIVAVDRDECDITSFESVVQCINLHEPDILLNCAAYTAVDDAEDIGTKMCYDVNVLWVYNLARATSVFGVDFITISTDYVFDGTNAEWYLPTDIPNPIGVYGMSKYLGERLALQENPRTIIVRTSWLYGGKRMIGLQNNRITEAIETCKSESLWNGKPDWIFKNFVNTMVKLSETRNELKVIDDQHGIPTSCVDLSWAISEIIEDMWAWEVYDHIFHFSNSCEEGSITWADFSREIFHILEKDIHIENCSTEDYPLKAKRPSWSILKNTSDIVLPDWKFWLKRYLGGK